jgi:hypothetical protein
MDTADEVDLSLLTNKQLIQKLKMDKAARIALMDIDTGKPNELLPMQIVLTCHVFFL